VKTGSREEALAIAAALERGMLHPLATAFRPFDDGRPAVTLRTWAGQGVEGRIGGQDFRIGTRGFATGASGGDEGIWLGTGRHAIARFDYADGVRTGAGEAVAALAEAGIAIEVLSGDSEARVGALASELGIRTWRARQTPAEKLARIESLRRAGRRVAMVGDGVNDAAVLAGASAAIALADGAALAQAAAGIVMAGRNLDRLPELFTIARQTRRVMRQNIAWAVAYNVLAVPLAAAGLVAPWLAALGMAASSLVVTLNALRLARPRTRGGVARNYAAAALSGAPT
jgi:P-type Cu2+ transporter